MQWAEKDSMHESVPYNEEKDVAFYQDIKCACELRAESGTFAIFFPNDIHKPGLMDGAVTPVIKIVVKIKV